MAVTSGFFNSLYGDRKYNAEQFSAMFDNLITDGVFSNVGNAFQVTADGSNVLIDVGRAWFNSVWVYNDTLYPLPVQPSEVLLDRIDAVVIEINHTEAIRAGRIFFVQGTASAEPQRPTLTNTDDIHQHVLAYVYRKAGATTITQADITNMIGTSDCPYVTGILATQDIDKVVAQWEAQFNQWFEDLQIELSGDVAANLASQILELNSRFSDLAKDGSVYEELQDSSNDTILDSNGEAVIGTTSFRQTGGGSDAEATGPSFYNFEMALLELDAKISSLQTTLSPKVGDMLTTTRTNLSNDYLLCNGAAINRADYPALSTLFTNRIKDPWKDVTALNQFHSFYDSVLSSSGLRCAYGGGYYVIAGQGNSYGENTNSASLRIYYSNSMDGPWTEKMLWYGPTGGNTNTGAEVIVRRIRYINGTFVICGSVCDNHYSSGSIDACIFYASNPTGTWTQKTVKTFSSPDSTNRVEVTDIAYGDGKYVITGLSKSNHTYGFVGYSTSLGRTFTITEYSYDDITSLYSVAYGNGYFVMAGEYDGGYRVWTTKTPQTASSWVRNTSSPFSEVTNGRYPYDAIRSVAYINNQFVAFAVSDADFHMAAMYASNPAGAWNTYDVYKDIALHSPYLMEVIRIGWTLSYEGGLFVFCGTVREDIAADVDRNIVAIFYSKSLTGPWTYITIPNIEEAHIVYPQYETRIYDVLFSNNRFMAVGALTGVDSNNNGGVISTDSSKMYLPEVENDYAYTYIKAK